MPAQEQLFLAAQQQQQRSANAGVRAPAAAPSGALAVGTTGAQGAPVPGAGPSPPHPSPSTNVSQTNVLSPTGHGHGARVTPTSTSSSDNNIGGNDAGTSHPDVVSPSTAATAPSSLSAAAPGESQQRLSPASLQKQSDDDSHKLSPSQTLLSHSSKMADADHDASPSSSSSSMLVDQVGKQQHSRERELPPSSDHEETDDCSQSSNSSESSNDSSEEGGGGGGLPPQPVQQAVAAANKVDPATLLLPSVEALADTETLILFDWDDTLLASTHLANSNYRLDEPDVLPETVTQQLSLLEDAVIDMLDLAAGLGTVCIITNAETGWVELSCKKFLPRVMAHVEGLPVVSARSTYEPKHPALPSKWKLEAFSHRIGQLCNETAHSKAKNVISLGDSHAEREAVRTVTRGLENTHTKSVKFLERPTLVDVIRQLHTVMGELHNIVHTPQHLDLWLVKSTRHVNKATVQQAQQQARHHAPPSPPAHAYHSSPFFNHHAHGSYMHNTGFMNVRNLCGPSTLDYRNPSHYRMSLEHGCDNVQHEQKMQAVEQEILPLILHSHAELAGVLRLSGIHAVEQEILPLILHSHAELAGVLRLSGIHVKPPAPRPARTMHMPSFIGRVVHVHAGVDDEEDDDVTMTYEETEFNGATAAQNALAADANAGANAGANGTGGANAGRPMDSGTSASVMMSLGLKQAQSRLTSVMRSSAPTTPPRAQRPADFTTPTQVPPTVFSPRRTAPTSHNDTAPLTPTAASRHPDDVSSDEDENEEAAGSPSAPPVFNGGSPSKALSTKLSSEAPEFASGRLAHPVSPPRKALLEPAASPPDMGDRMSDAL